MNRQRIILHVGTHKTGTTAIQTFAYEHRKPLYDKGIYYPLLSDEKTKQLKKGHNSLAHTLTTNKKKKQSMPVEDILSRWQEESKGIPILISAEAFWRHIEPLKNKDWLSERKLYLERVAESLKGFDIEVLVVLREQSSFLNSLYLENIMKGSKANRMEFEDFCQFLAKRHLRYLDNLQLFQELIGPIRILTYYEITKNNQLCHNFFDPLGIKVHELPEPGHIRISLSPSQARIKQLLNPLMLTKGLNNSTNNLLKRCIPKESNSWWIQKYSQEFWPSEEKRKAWQRMYENENESIRALYRPDLQKLFPET